MMRYSLGLLAWLAIVAANPVPLPQAVTDRLLPTGSSPSSCFPSLAGSFGIAVATVAPPAKPAKRDVASTTSCGPLTVAHISQIGDGQIQAAISYVTFLSVNQTGDCQLAPASELSEGQHVGAVTQIGDGQLQAPVATTPPPAPSVTPTVAPVVVPAPTVTPPAVVPAPTVTPPAPAPTSASSIAPPPPPPPPPPPAPQSISSTFNPPPPPPPPSSTPAAPVSSPGSALPPPARVASSSSSSNSVAPPTESSTASVTPPFVICDKQGSLAITLEDGVLKDQDGRTGYIAANYQFQFDGPPQAGAIITAGFSACNNGSLALGGSNVFYQCLSGSFYNLYDRPWAAQCSPVLINTLLIKKC